MSANIEQSNKYDICEGYENVPVYINKNSYTKLCKNFQYVCCNILGPDTDSKEFEEEIAGCTCLKASCDITTDSTCTCLKFGCAYDGHGKLNMDLVRSKTVVIQECNTFCSCSKSCLNRIVQRGITCHMEIFEDATKSLCVKTLDDVIQGTFLCEYAGEILTQKEAHRRSSLKTQEDMNYIFILREHVGTEVLTTIIDPTFKGNIGRFINHSCKPNLVVLPVRIYNMVPKLCLFAARDIQAGEELTYSYGKSTNANLKSEDQEKLIKSGKECMCGTKTCQGFLPFDASII